ncbi:hypothetical protein AB9K41_07325 [Cribrihabitans sp. XS_ASV171]
MKCHTNLAAVLTLLAVPALAQQDSSGTISGTFDAADTVWSIEEPGREGLPDSGWSMTDGPIEVTLSAIPDKAEMGLHGVLVVEFTLAEAPGADAGADASVRLMDSERGQDLRAGPENIDIALTTVEREGDSLILAGDLVATMTPGGSDGLVLDDQSARLLDGNFQATLWRDDTADSGS